MSMKRILGLCLALVLLACDNKNDKKTTEKVVDHNVEFEEFKSQFIEELWKENPIWASYEGFHDYDSILPIPNEENRQKSLSFAKNMQNELNQFNEKDLSDLNRIDWYMIRDYLMSIEFFEKEFKSYEWNPASYNLGGAFFQVINYRKDPLDKRLKNIQLKLKNVDA